MAHILICDDEMFIHKSLGIYCESELFDYTSVFDGKDALEYAMSGKFDIVILDIMMPHLSGIDVCKEIRKVSQIPIIMLSAKGEEIDILLGLELGADDYIIKPFNPREVLARVKTVLRRYDSSEFTDNNSAIKYLDLKVDLRMYRLTVKDTSINATPKEIEILYKLIKNKGITLSRDEILEDIWGADYTYVDRRTIDTHINRIRSHLPEEYAQNIKSVYGEGYRFEAGI